MLDTVWKAHQGGMYLKISKRKHVIFKAQGHFFHNRLIDLPYISPVDTDKRLRHESSPSIPFRKTVSMINEDKGLVSKNRRGKEKKDLVWLTCHVSCKSIRCVPNSS